ncbi:MAG: cadherin domain-containing protein, partial [Chlorobium sp.]
MDREYVVTSSKINLSANDLLVTVFSNNTKDHAMISAARGLVIADAALQDADVLLGQLDPGMDLWRIDLSTDVGEILEKAFSCGYDKLHFLGHGQSGTITLGAKELDVNDFKALAYSSASAPSLHFWSCLTGAGEKGRAFVDGIACAIGSVVTAFSGLVGAQSKGGSWLPDVFSHERASVGVPFVNAYAYAYTLETTSEQALINAINAQTFIPSTTSSAFISLLNAVGADAGSSYRAQALLLATALTTLDANRFTALKYDLVSNWAHEATPVPYYGTITELWDELQPLADLRIAADNGFKASKAGNLTLAHFEAMSASVQAIPVGTIVSGQAITADNIASASLIADQIRSIYPTNRFPQLSTFLQGYANTQTNPALQDVWLVLTQQAQSNNSSPVFTSISSASINESALVGTPIYTAVTADSDIYAYHTYTLGGTDKDLLSIDKFGVVTLKGSANYDAKASYSFSVIASDGAHSATLPITVAVNNLAPTTIISEVHFSADTGTSNTDFITKTAAQTITGTLSAATVTGEVVKVSMDNGATWSTATNTIGQNSFSLTGVTLTGSSTLKVKVEDASGTAGTVTSHTYVLDNVAPATAISGLLFSNDSGVSSTDFVANSGVQTITATLSAPLALGEVLMASLDNGVTWDDVSNKVSGTTFSSTTNGNPLSGSSVLKIHVMDAAGNTGPTTSQAYVIDTVGPTITSGATATAINENSGAGQVVYTATSTDLELQISGVPVIYSLKAGVGDAGLFSINASTGAVTLTANPDYEAKTSYSFTVQANDRANVATEKAVTLAINNLNDNQLSAVTDSNPAANSVAENAVAGTAVGVTALATDADRGAVVTYSLLDSASGKFAIDSATGVITVASTGALDYEKAFSHNVIVSAASSDGSLSTTEIFKINVTNVNDTAPVFTSGSTGSVNENAETSTVIYTATTTVADALAIPRIYTHGGTDAALVAIDASSGAVTLKASADYESARKSYSFDVIAANGINTATQAVVVSVNNLPDGVFNFTSSGTGSIAENAATSTVIYTAHAEYKDGTSSTPIYTLSGTDATLLDITSAGVVTLKASADFETKSSYSFNVIANDAGNSATQAVAVSVVNLNDNSPLFTSGTTGSVNENAAISTVIYTAATTDADNLAARTYTLSGTDASLLDITSAGVVTLKASADYESGKTSYSFNVIANDGDITHNTTQSVVVSVNNLNDNAPVFTSGGTGSVDENAAKSRVIYTAATTDADNLVARTYTVGGTDANLLDITSDGVVTLKASANYESKDSYSFTVIANDGANNTTQAVIVQVNNLNDNAPVFTSGAVGSVNENAATSSVIYIATTTDKDNLAARTYTLSGTDASLLDITSIGVVTLKASANYEAKSSYSFNVIANDGANNTTQAVVVQVNNLNDNAPVFTSGGAGLVNENAATSTVIYSVTTTDADNPVTPPTFTLGGADAALLNITSAGVVTLKATADYEDPSRPSHSYSFNVIANDGVNTKTQSVVVAVDNLNDNAPVFTSGVNGSVNENAATNTVIYTAVTTDADNLAPRTYTLSGTDAGALNINATTGAVTLIASADYEAKTSYSFNVIANDGDVTHNTTQAVVVSVVNLNDNAPVFISGSTGSVNENAAPGTAIYTSVTTDADNLAARTYSLGGTDAALLNITSAGVVTLKASADYESGKSSYSFDVIANDGDVTHNTTKAVGVSVNNLNDNPVTTITDSNTVPDSVAENAGTGTPVGITAFATDGDAGTTISYSLTDNAGGKFAIGSATGIITVAGALDYETATSHNVTVLATSSDGSTNTRSFTIGVKNANDNPVTTLEDTDAAANSVAENAGVGTVVGVTALATDGDTGTTISYSLSDSAGGKFAIGSTTGIITVAGALDYETATSHSVTVKATSSDGSTNTQIFTIGVTNVNDNAPVFTSGATGAVDENAATSTVVYTSVTSDADNPVALPTYTLGGTDASLVSISSTGAVTLKTSANFEAKASYSFDVIANDGLNSTSKAVLITVNNLLEGGLEFTSGGTGSVDENAPASRVIYTPTTTSTSPASVTYVLDGADASLLNINASTGAVTLKASADYESNQKSYSFNITATDSSTGNVTKQPLLVSVNNLNDNAPVFTSGATGAVDENAATSTVIYSAATTDSDGGVRTYTLLGGDSSLLNITTAGLVTLKTSADYESSQKSYSFSVVAHDPLATDASDHAVSQAVVVQVNNLNDNNPAFTSGGIGTVNENAALSTVIYAAATSDLDGGTRTYSLNG